MDFWELYTVLSDKRGGFVYLGRKEWFELHSSNCDLKELGGHFQLIQVNLDSHFEILEK